HFVAEWKPALPSRIVAEALPVRRIPIAELLCSAAHSCAIPSKIPRDILFAAGLMYQDNREGRKKSALLRGQSLGRMRSRRGNSQPPVSRKADRTRLNCKASCLAFFLCKQQLAITSCRNA